MYKLIFSTLLLLSLTACSGGGDDKKEEEVVKTCQETNTCPDPVVKKLKGTVATGVAVAAAEIIVTDANGVELDVTATTDANGNYTVEFEGETIPAPVLISVITSDGEELNAIVDDANATTANVNPVTNFVADQLLTNSQLSSLTSGSVAAAGQTLVETVFGAGAQYDAFASDSFVAKTSTSDTTTQVSTADVLLDTLAEVAGSNGIDALLTDVQNNATPLLESTEFVVSLATNLAEVEGENTSISEVFDLDNASEEVKQQLAVVDTVQSVAESVIAEVAANSELTAEQQQATVDGLMDVIGDVVSSDNTIDTAAIEQVASNVVTNLTDDLVKVITSEEAANLSDDELAQAVENAADDIVTVIKDSNVDLSTENPDLSKVDANLDLVIKLDSPNNWDSGDWDKMAWQ